MNKKNIFIFDVDGTLIVPFSSNELHLNKYTSLCINEASKYGKVVIATARPYHGTTHLFENLTEKIYSITNLNGAIARYEEVIKTSKPISKDFLKHVLKYDIKDLWFFTKNDWYVSNKSSDIYKAEENALQMKSILLQEYDFSEDIYKVITVSQDNIDLKEIVKEYKDTLELTMSTDIYNEINVKGTNKYTVLSLLFDDIENYNVFAFGDSTNDMEMVKNATFSCVPSNAHKKLKEEASFISSHKFAKGIYEGIQTIIKKYDLNPITKA